MQERYIASVDLGTSKFAVAVAKATGEDVQVIYYKETASDGIRYGGVYNPGRASSPLKAAIQSAEEELGIKILQVVVGLPRYGVRQETAPAKIDRSNPGECITREEVSALKSLALDTYVLDDQVKEEIYGAVAQSFATDDMIQGTEADVVGVPSETLEGTFKVFIGTKKPISNLDKVMNVAGVAIARKYFLPNAIGQVVLNREEMENGVAMIEFGAGVTSLTIYQGSIMRYYNAIPFGGANITSDIKYECGFQSSLAENIKLAFGACLPDRLQSMSEKIIQINDDEDGSSQQLPVKYLSEIITCRCREIINAILFLIQQSGYADRLRNGIVLTGGGANLTNLANMIREISGYNVRVGYPRSKRLSTYGCNGINETSAVASVAMLSRASTDTHLNCIDEQLPAQEPAPEAVPAEEQGPVLGEDNHGSLFQESEIEVVPPERKKKKDRPEKKPRITWGRKIKEGFAKTIDSTLGNLYDTME